MIVYEVNLFVQHAIAESFESWLHGHVREILALPGFTGAQVFERLQPAPSDGEKVWCTQYQLPDEAALEHYLQHHAPRLRADGVARFGDRFRAERRVLARVSTY